ncbi:hypothetical protein [Amycolatopsis taiwanensis]|uniref:Uncharacterized protein n=1 Tax=Amycolatopsis taiwanensis TaxID=342230 RepID=A0A9W6VL85_9PSEU|nr:hypothetical protein [Amycolatopsis taiwanensis]GLY71379.1 hypothetical protein Atai01_79980 [Amycolatopsis taiwanensis]
MATSEEIERRVEANDAARSARRAAAAKRVGELAQQRAAVVEQLAGIEHELGDVLASARDVIDVDELARFTDVPASDLTQWLTARTTRKPARAKRKRPSTNPSGANNDTSAEPPSPAIPAAGRKATPRRPDVPGASAPNARVPEEVT